MSQTDILGHNPAEEEVEWFSKLIPTNENTGTCPHQHVMGGTIFLFKAQGVPAKTVQSPTDQKSESEIKVRSWGKRPYTLVGFCHRVPSKCPLCPSAAHVLLSLWLWADSLQQETQKNVCWESSWTGMKLSPKHVFVSCPLLPLVLPIWLLITYY